MKKRWIAVMLSLALSFTLAVPIFADDAEYSTEGTGALGDDPFLTPELEAEMARLAKEKDAEMEKILQQLKESGSTMAENSYSWPITLQKQINNYYCGPASARVALSFHQWKSGVSRALPSQKELGEKIRTDEQKASSSAMIAQALNSYSGKYGTFKYTAVKYDKKQPYDDWANKVYGDIAGKVNSPINLVQTQYMNRYEDEGKRIRHYINLSGWHQNVKVRTNDPHYDDKFYGSRWEKIGSGSKNGIFKATWEADKKKANRGLIY